MTEVSDATGDVSSSNFKEDVPGTGSPPDPSGSSDAVDSFRKRNKDRKRTIFREIARGVAFGAGKETGELIVHEHGQDLLDRGHDLVNWFISLLGS